MSPTNSVGVIRIGRLGHLALNLRIPGDATSLPLLSVDGITPVTEHFPMSRINDAIEHLQAGKARYRIVLDRE